VARHPEPFKPAGVPIGRRVELPGRGAIWVREQPGPKDAATLVLLHGLGATGGLNWGSAIVELGRTFRVIAVDHRGHGRGIRTGRFRLEDCAEDVAALADELHLDRPVLVGYSMGGPIAALVWRNHRDLPRGMVFCATSRNFRGTPGEKAMFLAMAMAGLSPFSVPQVLLRSWAGLLCAIPTLPTWPANLMRWTLDEMAGHDPRCLIQAAGELGRFDASSWIHEVDVPTAVVATTRDQLVSIERQVRLAQAIPSAVLHPVESGHLNSLWRGANPFVETLVGACEEVVRRAGQARLVASPAIS
jgi:pimeloyl-ACP methyl ester carboxylesterase